MVHGQSSVFLWNQVLDFPVPLLNTDGELEVFLCNGVPILSWSAFRQLLNHGQFLTL